MEDTLIQKLRFWRKEVAQKNGVDLFRVLPNKVLEDIARLKPKHKDELLAVKGIREKKFEKYGNDVLALIREHSGEYVQEAPQEEQEKDKVYSVSDYLDAVNYQLSQIQGAVRGEVSSISFRNGHAYFSIKDTRDESLLNCFMWARNYEMSGIELVEGMEIIVNGVLEVYKPYGKLTFKASMVELVGEGALKKAYEALKRTLDQEGLFAPERKKPIPQFPHRIGLITSRNGAVINDFMSNIGKFGYNIVFVDSRVEGASAISDLLSAVDYFSDKNIDVLVMIRGGGSLESLQAFNNEMLVRKVASLPMPVICGIGHDKDKPLVTMVADLECSTPSIVAATINKSWERALDKLEAYEKTILFTYEEWVRGSLYTLENTSARIWEFYQGIFRMFENKEQDIKNNLSHIHHSIRQEAHKIQRLGGLLKAGFENGMSRVKKELDIFEKGITQANPERLLKLGYSITTLHGKVLRSTSQIKKGDVLISKFADGSVHSKAQ